MVKRERVQVYKQEIENKTPYFFLVTKEYSIGTPKGAKQSDKTFDISFESFVYANDLQKILNLATTDLDRDTWDSDRLKAMVTSYLSSFIEDLEERAQGKKYLEGNGLLRILIYDKQLAGKFRNKFEELKHKGYFD